MIPRDAAADRSNTNGTVGCNIPFTAGPGVMARVFWGTGRGGRKDRHRQVTHHRHAARGRILGSRASDRRPGRRRREEVSDTRLGPQFQPFADFRIDHGIAGRGRCVVGRDRGPQLAFRVLMGRAERVQFGAQFRREFVQAGQLSESRTLR